VQSKNIYILKHKGLAKHLVDETWFESQYADPSLTKQMTVVDNFRVSLPTLDIARKEMQLSLGIKLVKFLVFPTARVMSFHSRVI
jgi:hypothetical protein